MTTLTFRVASVVLAITSMLTLATLNADAQGAGPKAGDAKKALVKSNKQLKPRGGSGNIQTALAMGCNESTYFAPTNGGYLNVVAMPNPGDAIASATSSVSNYRPAGRVRPGGTDGGIEVTSGGFPGGTTMITYVLENFEGEQVTVDLTVTVTCPKDKPKKTTTGGDPLPPLPPIPPGPGPQPDPPKPPKAGPKIVMGFNRIPTHVVSACSTCQAITQQLNAVIDKLSAEMTVTSSGFLRGPESAAADYQQYELLLAELKDCEKNCLHTSERTAVTFGPPVAIIIDRKHDDEVRKDEYRKDEPKKSDVSRTNPATSDRKPATVDHEKTATTDARKSATVDHAAHTDQHATETALKSKTSAATATRSHVKTMSNLGHAATGASRMASLGHTSGMMSHLGGGMMHMGGMHMGGMHMGMR